MYFLEIFVILERDIKARLWKGMWVVFREMLFQGFCQTEKIASAWLSGRHLGIST